MIGIIAGLGHVPVQLADDDLFLAVEFILLEYGKPHRVLDEPHYRFDMRARGREVILNDLFLGLAVVHLADVVYIADPRDVLDLRLNAKLGVAVRISESERIAKTAGSRSRRSPSHGLI